MVQVTYTPSNQQAAAASTSSGFPGSGLSASDSNLGITKAQGDGAVIVAPAKQPPPGAMGPPSAPSTALVRDLLNEFDSFTPSQVASWGQQLFDAGFMSDSVYNSGSPTTTDTYNAFKKAVLEASQARVPLSDYLTQHFQTFQAQGGPKVKLPSARYTAPLTSYDDVAKAADGVFQQLLGRRATNAEKAALTQTLNQAELAGKTQEAQSAYSQLLAYRGLNADGTRVSADTPQGVPAQTGVPAPAQTAGVAGGLAAGLSGRAGTPASTPGAAAPGSTVGPAGLATTVTNQQGNASTVTSGPIVTPYTAPPSPDALAYNTAMTNNAAEVKGRTVAAAMQAIRQFVGQE